MKKKVFIMCKKTDPIIMEMTNDIVKMCSPFQVLLISKKTDKNGALTAFKICIVVADSYQDHRELESEILINTDCPVPCDIIVYNITEWNECVDDDCTFAYRVDSEGEVLYEQK